MKQIHIKSLLSVLSLMLVAAESRADIYQWAYVDPSDPSQGVIQSTTVCPSGSGVSAAPSADLSYLNLTQAYLINANLTGANLNSTDLSSGMLTNANLSGATVAGANFTSTNVAASQFYSTATYQVQNLQGIGLAGCDLTFWSFSGQNLTNADLYAATLTNADLAGAIVAGANLGYSWDTSQLYNTGNVTLAFAPATWAVSGTGSWNTPGSWAEGLVPNGVNRQAVLGAIPTTTPYSVGGAWGTNSVALGDVDGDGKLDIVAGTWYNSSYSGGVVSSLLNHGDGTFAAAQNYDSGYGTNDVELADLNGDGKLDIATASEFGSIPLSVFLQQAAPSLELIGPDQTTVLATSASTADFNSAIVNYTATQDGTYYIVVSATLSEADYTLVVTRNADLPAPSSPAGPLLAKTVAALPATATTTGPTTPPTSSSPLFAQTALAAPTIALTTTSLPRSDLGVLDSVFAEAALTDRLARRPDGSHLAPRDLAAKDNNGVADLSQAPLKWKGIVADSEEMRLLVAHQTRNKSALDQAFASYRPKRQGVKATACLELQE